MGIGWDYFNNVCMAVQGAYRFVMGLIGLIAVCFVGWGAMQAINANRPDPTLIVAPKETPAGTPAAKLNPQFKPVPGMATPTNSGVPAAATSNTNAQFGSPRGAAPGNAGVPAPSPAAAPDMRPNPQFSGKSE